MVGITPPPQLALPRILFPVLYNSIRRVILFYYRVAVCDSLSCIILSRMFYYIFLRAALCYSLRSILTFHNKNILSTLILDNI